MKKIISYSSFCSTLDKNKKGYLALKICPARQYDALMPVTIYASKILKCLANFYCIAPVQITCGTSEITCTHGMPVER